MAEVVTNTTVFNKNVLCICSTYPKKPNSKFTLIILYNIAVHVVLIITFIYGKLGNIFDFL